MGDDVLDVLRENFARLNVELDQVIADIVELKERTGLLESGYASMSRRLDRMGGDLALIGRRLGTVDEPAH